MFNRLFLAIWNTWMLPIWSLFVSYEENCTLPSKRGSPARQARLSLYSHPQFLFIQSMSRIECDMVVYQFIWLWLKILLHYSSAKGSFYSQGPTYFHKIYIRKTAIFNLIQAYHFIWKWILLDSESWRKLRKSKQTFPFFSKPPHNLCCLLILTITARSEKKKLANLDITIIANNVSNNHQHHAVLLVLFSLKIQHFHCGNVACKGVQPSFILNDLLNRRSRDWEIVRLHKIIHYVLQYDLHFLSLDECASMILPYFRTKCYFSPGSNEISFCTRPPAKILRRHLDQVDFMRTRQYFLLLQAIHGISRVCTFLITTYRGAAVLHTSFSSREQPSSPWSSVSWLLNMVCSSQPLILNHIDFVLLPQFQLFPKESHLRSSPLAGTCSHFSQLTTPIRNGGEAFCSKISFSIMSSSIIAIVVRVIAIIIIVSIALGVALIGPCINSPPSHFAIHLTYRYPPTLADYCEQFDICFI